MYGIIYVAIKDYAEAAFGTETWQNIVAESGLNINFNLTEQPYNEDTVAAFASAIAKVTGISTQEALYKTGYQIAGTTSQKYPDVMLSRGDTIQEYFLNLPAFHNRISLIYPELTAPEFRITEAHDRTMVMEYLYKRKEFWPYVHGYLTGIGQYFDPNAQVTPLPEKTTGSHMVYKISW